ncbi:MAG: hypothetical protein ABJA76_05740 [Mucilaginibacter sp.]
MSSRNKAMGGVGASTYYQESNVSLANLSIAWLKLSASLPQTFCFPVFKLAHHELR